jgi:hypothetical protein
MSKLADSDVLEVLRAVDRGEIILESVEQVYSGNRTYKTNTGWVLVVFIDCNDWDYLDSATAPDGRTWNYDLSPDSPDLLYEPADPRQWGLPAERE